MLELPKQDVYQRLNFTDVEQMNLTLLALADCLVEQGLEVPDQIANPHKYSDISKDHLTLLQNHMQKALSENEAPQLPSGDSRVNGNSAIAPATSERVTDTNEAPQLAPGTLAGFRVSRKQLGVQYVAKAAAYDISDSFFLELDKSLAERNAQNLAERIDIYKGEFNAAVESIQHVAQERAEWEETSLGKFNALANFTDLDEKLATIQK